jgi:hypothetical protein
MQLKRESSFKLCQIETLNRNNIVHCDQDASRVVLQWHLSLPLLQYFAQLQKKYVALGSRHTLVSRGLGLHNF